MVPPLPHELSDCIIDFLHDDGAALAACARTCRAWLAAVRYHRFAGTRVHGRLSPFAELLTLSPSVASFVRALHIHGFPYPHVRRYVPEELVALLDRLPALAHLGLTSMKLDGAVVSALVENRTFRRISRLDIRWCEAEHVEDVVRLLTTPSLEHVEIDSLLCHEYESDASIDLPALKTMSIAGMNRANDFSRRIVAGKHRIQAFRALITWRGEAELVADILSSLAGSLEHLDIDIDAESNLPAVFDDTNFSLEILPYIRTCRLHFSLREMLVAGNMSLPLINSLITQALSSTRLEKIALRIKADGMEDLRALDSECGVRDVSVAHFDDMTVLDWERLQVAVGTRALKSFVIEGQGSATRFLENVCSRCPELGALVHPRHVR
ncbi:hypothetical protein PsYK624_110110 [Phanerochaete sordida]|uniref:F-box domain-containing protein n=1 Tax=Phanerochaete sordida TaxID=48140 RepID=A0A9P3GH47_9APHY|nr:hypothetical protein PsYK624_110110 [Phanerochaete sordida]